MTIAQHREEIDSHRLVRQRRIMYAVDLDTAQIVSRIGSQYAWPILDFEGMKPENNFQANYYLEKISIHDAHGTRLHHTRKIPIEAKNFHRAFWGMKPLKGGIKI